MINLPTPLLNFPQQSPENLNAGIFFQNQPTPKVKLEVINLPTPLLDFAQQYPIEENEYDILQTGNNTTSFS